MHEKCPDMEVDDQLLMKYMQGLCSEEEKDVIDAWLEESESNKAAFREAHHLFEGIVVSVDPERLRYRSSRKKGLAVWKKIAVGLVSAAAVVAVTAFVTVTPVSGRLSEELLTADVPAGKMMTLTLYDGTKVDLNSGARLVYPPMFWGKERQVELEGEAMFHVTHDTSRPFTVKTFAADIKVLGTKFNVNADRSNNEFSTSLVEGKVLVTSTSDPSEKFFLAPDHTISLKSGHFCIENHLEPQTLYWPAGLINIAGTPFDELMECFEKAFGVTIEIQCEEMPVIECTSGEVRISDGLDNAMKVLMHVADFDYMKDGRSGTVYIR